MGLKLYLTFVLLCVRSCLNHPIDGQANDIYDAKCAPKFGNDFSMGDTNAGIFAPQSLPNLPIANLEYVDRQGLPGIELSPLPSGLDYLNPAESHGLTYSIGHRPVLRPPSRPRPEPPIQIPDDVEVFAPVHPYPPARPIPIGPNLEGGVETLWPTSGSGSGRPIPFPKEGFVGLEDRNLEMLPILVENGGFLGLPTNAVNEIPTMQGTVGNERPAMNEGNGLPLMPVMIEKPNPIILAREQPQMMNVLVRGDPVGTIPSMMQTIKGPAIIEAEHPHMMFFDENKQAAPMSMENEMTFMSPARSFNDDGKIARNPSEFTPIPLELPERFKREDQLDTNDSKHVVLLQKEEFDRIKQKSIFDNEIPNDGQINNDDGQINNDVKLAEDNDTDSFFTEKLNTSNESVLNSESGVIDETLSMNNDNTPPTPILIDETSATDDISRTNILTASDIKKPTFGIENIPVLSPVLSIRPITNKPSKEPVTPYTILASNKPLIDSNPPLVEKVLVEVAEKNDQVQNLNISNPPQPSTNNDKKIIATISTNGTSDAKIENSNSNLDKPDEIINNEQTKDKIQSITRPTEIPITEPSSTGNVAEIKAELMKQFIQLLENFLKNKKEQPTPPPLDNHFIDLPHTCQPSGQFDAAESTQLTHVQPGEIQYEGMFPHLPYLPVHSQKLQHNMNGFGQSFGNPSREFLNLQHGLGDMDGSRELLSLSQPYPSFNNFHHQVPEFRHYQQ